MGVAVDLLQRGGPVLYVLVAASVTALALSLAKAFQFARLDLGSAADNAEVIARIGDPAVSIESRDAMDAGGPLGHFIGDAFEFIERERPAPAWLEQELRHRADKTIGHFEKGLPLLASIATLSPLLGLLGTVIGMISAFVELEAAGNLANPSSLSGGIWEALITTAYGLAVAIPTTVCVHYFEERLTEIGRALEGARVNICGVLDHEREPRVSDPRRIEQSEYAA